MRWLVVSVVLSVVLAVFLNVALRAFPDAGHRIVRRVTERAKFDDASRHDGRVRVFVPWKAMIVASVVLTVVVNLVIWMR